jgi:transposase
MNTTQPSYSTSQNRGEQVRRGGQVSVKKVQLIKLGLDVHADSISVVRQLDEATPQPAQKFTPGQFLVWASKQLTLADQVHSCYEAGPFGYCLHRQLTVLGIVNLVIRPQKWDELGKGVKTDKTDALALCQRLDRYVQGNHKALAVVRVPTPEEEAARWPSRLREQLRRQRQRLEAQGRSLLLTQGLRVRGRWWQLAGWQRLNGQLPAALLAPLAVIRKLILAVHAEVEQLTRELEAASVCPQPRGVGALTSEVIRREIGDWQRFVNRRQVASYTGLCPSVYASGKRMVQGSITKHGNPRLRHALIEMAWRLVHWQPQYRAVAKWRARLVDGTTTKARKKKIIVALARQLAIDLWRVASDRCQAAALGLVID